MEQEKNKTLTREEKLQIIVEKGFKYNSETGLIHSKLGKEITAKDAKKNILIFIKSKDFRFYVFGHQYAWFVTYNEIPEEIKHLNGINNDNRIINLKASTHQENHLSKIGKGYSWDKNINMWVARTSVKGKFKQLGKFYNEEDARQAYLEYKKMINN